MAIPATTEITAKISAYIVANFLFGEAARLPVETESFIENGIIDSTGILELIEYLESEFGIEVREEETIPQNLDSLSNLTRYVSEKLAG
jgi:acyl carrier protein